MQYPCFIILFYNVLIVELRFILISVGVNM